MGVACHISTRRNNDAKYNTENSGHSLEIYKLLSFKILV